MRARRALLLVVALLAIVLWPVARHPSAVSDGTGPVASLSALRLNEIRLLQPGTDADEYVEITGPPGTSLDGVSYVVLGDDVGGSGCVEEIVTLDGIAIGPSGIVFIAQPSFSLVAPGRTQSAEPDLVVWLNLENHENLTHLLVFEFRGHLGLDLDDDDDGTLDLTPWTSILDAVATVEGDIPPAPGAEWWYAEPIGPKRDGTTPYHILRDRLTGEWLIGPDDPVHQMDTPGTSNPTGPAVLDAPGDINGDGAVDGADLYLLMLVWSDPAKFPELALLADIDGDGAVGPTDLSILLVNWGMQW